MQRADIIPPIIKKKIEASMAGGVIRKVSPTLARDIDVYYLKARGRIDLEKPHKRSEAEVATARGFKSIRAQQNSEAFAARLAEVDKRREVILKLLHEDTLPIQIAAMLGLPIQTVHNDKAALIALKQFTTSQEQIKSTRSRARKLREQQKK